MEETPKLRESHAAVESALRAECDDLVAKVARLEADKRHVEETAHQALKTHDANLSALRAELEGRVSDRESEIARVESELAETKLSLESERDALQAQLVELSSAQDEELATTLAAQLSEHESEIAREQSQTRDQTRDPQAQRAMQTGSHHVF